MQNCICHEHISTIHCCELPRCISLFKIYGRWVTDTSFVSYLFFHCRFDKWSSRISMTGSITVKDCCLLSADIVISESWCLPHTHYLCCLVSHSFPFLSFLPLWLSCFGAVSTTCITMKSKVFINISEFFFTIRLFWA